MFSSRFFSFGDFFLVFFRNVDGNSGRLLGPDNLEFLMFGISAVPKGLSFGCMAKKILANL